MEEESKLPETAAYLFMKLNIISILAGKITLGIIFAVICNIYFNLRNSVKKCELPLLIFQSVTFQSKMHERLMRDQTSKRFKKTKVMYSVRKTNYV